MDQTLLMLLASIMGLGLLGIFFGSTLAFASKKFAVKVDPKVEAVTEVLCGANCGACGFPGCSAFAEAVVIGKAPIDGCIPGGSECAQKIAGILGQEVGADTEESVAVVQCQGGNKEASERFQYQGIQDCNAAVLIAEGSKGCIYGCLGLGSCVAACPFDAMRMNDNGLPEVLEDKCTACGICVQTCPRDIMAIIPKKQKIYLGCKSQDRGKKVKQVCKVGCTGCTLCANPKVTPSGSIEMRGFLPEIININADDLETALEKCPTKSYVKRSGDPVKITKLEKQVETENN